ncbi:MAG: Dam family site-specific DNA-(adenine-N6)-methyltransferase [Lactococcus lactis]
MRYIGSKLNLLTEIEKIIEENTQGREKTFLDLFAGTNVVGKHFKSKYAVYSNDLLYFSYVNAKATIENNFPLAFEGLNSIGIASPLDYLQKEAGEYIKTGKVGYYEKSYTPTGDAMYLTVENGKRIDYIRDTIEEWKIQGLLNEYEYYYLVSVLVESIPFVSNITGTYGAFLKHWDKRALNSLELIPLEVTNNGAENMAFNLDSNVLVSDVKVDIAYIDTPYNNRQYASNYHLLENIAQNEKPDLTGKTKIFKWNHLRSDYAMKKKALSTMKELIEKLDATHVIVSYNNEGIIPEEELINLLRQNSLNSKVQVKKIPYRKYKSKRPSESYDLYELLIYFQKKENIEKNIDGNVETFSQESNKWTVEKQTYIKSPLNYIGGKYKLLKQIVPLFPEPIETFVDLFSGGANVGINVDARRYIFNDMNNKINEMFRFFATQNVDELISKIKNRIDEFSLSKTNEEGFIKFRKQYNENPNPLDLYVLVSYSYNYQFRFNSSMEFNNPFGRNRSRFSENMEKNLRLFVEKLNTIDATFTDKLFDDIDISNLGASDFVYLDPPYLITTGNYNDGNRGFINWDDEQEKKMYKLMEQLSNQGVRYALSNVLTHKGKENTLLKEFIETHPVEVHYLDFNYNNSSHNSKGKGSVEILITNYRKDNKQIIVDKTSNIATMS